MDLALAEQLLLVVSNTGVKVCADSCESLLAMTYTLLPENH
jgi:hypothetical protein